MRSAMKWTLPLMAAAALLAGYSLTSSFAQDTKAKVSGIVKQADGAVAASLPVSIYKGDVVAQLTPARGGRGGGGAGGGGRGGAGGPPAGQQAGPAAPAAGAPAAGAPAAGAPGAGPTSMPTALHTGTTDDKGAYKFEGLDAGTYTILAGRVGGGGRGGAGRGGAGGPPAGQQAGPGGAGAPGAGAAGGPGAGGRAGGFGGGFGRGTLVVVLKAGESKTDANIDLVAGRGGRGGAGGAGGAGGGGRNGGTPPGQ